MAKCDRCEQNEIHEPFVKCVECIRYVLGKPVTVVSSVLAYMNTYRHGGSKVKIITACLKHFSDDEIDTARKNIWKEYEYILGNAPKCKGSNVKVRSEFILGDIFDAFI